MHKFDFVQIKEYLDSVSEHSKIYIGCDSAAYKRHGKWYADFYKVIISMVAVDVESLVRSKPNLITLQIVRNLHIDC